MRLVATAPAQMQAKTDKASLSRNDVGVWVVEGAGLCRKSRKKVREREKKVTN